MPVATFKVTVESSVAGEQNAIAEASRYLAYADQSDLFGYHGSVDNVAATMQKSGTWIVAIEFTATVAAESDVEQFLDECNLLARVENAVCISNPTIPKN